MFHKTHAYSMLLEKKNLKPTHIPAKAPGRKPEPEPEMDMDDALELTERVEDEDEPMDVADDLMIMDREPDPEPEPEVEFDAEPEEEPEEDSLIDAAPASAAAGMFAALSENLRVSSQQGQTLEGIVRELMRPMLKQWLDENLPSIVEEKVQAEIERIARRGR